VCGSTPPWAPADRSARSGITPVFGRTLSGYRAQMSADDFLALHRPGDPLLQPNAWDVGSARILASLGFRAIATTSSGFAATLGRTDGAVSRDEALEHCRQLSAAVEVPVAADLENCFADSPDAVAETVRRAAETGLAGCSVEDYSGRETDHIYDAELAHDRVAAAAEAAHSGGLQLVLTARAEGLLHGGTDLGEIIARLQAFQEAGADVLFAPGLRSIEDIRTVVAAVDRPVNVLAGPGRPTVSELADAGVARISVGGAFAFAAYATLVEIATELRDQGSYELLARAAEARTAINNALA
jgi:2-methylisocitrate lyase-like PEP mutase family enzyme